ncbi:hypothetical protein KKG45_00710 [bacterium]|nr:hypothetical protein [bacterium]MBU1071746.1 hypothetical protein [bacterium]
MALQPRTPSTTTRIALAIWSVLLPVLPVPAAACEPPPPAPVHPPACCCCVEEAVPGCAREASLPCASGNGCARCPLVSGALVFIAPDGVGLEGLDPLAMIRPDDQFPREAFYTPPDPPPRSAVPS